MTSEGTPIYLLGEAETKALSPDSLIQVCPGCLDDSCLGFLEGEFDDEIEAFLGSDCDFN